MWVAFDFGGCQLSISQQHGVYAWFCLNAVHLPSLAARDVCYCLADEADTQTPSVHVWDSCFTFTRAFPQQASRVAYSTFAGFIERTYIYIPFRWDFFGTNTYPLSSRTLESLSDKGQNASIRGRPSYAFDQGHAFPKPLVQVTEDNIHHIR